MKSVGCNRLDVTNGLFYSCMLQHAVTVAYCVSSLSTDTWLLNCAQHYFSPMHERRYLPFSLSLSLCVQHHAYSPHHNLQTTPHPHKEKRKNVIFHLRLRLRLPLQHANKNDPKNLNQRDMSAPPQKKEKRKKKERKKERNEISPKPPLDHDSQKRNQTSKSQPRRTLKDQSSKEGGGGGCTARTDVPRTSGP